LRGIALVPGWEKKYTCFDSRFTIFLPYELAAGVSNNQIVLVHRWQMEGSADGPVAGITSSIEIEAENLGHAQQNFVVQE
jgi:hypothetical protein